MKLFNKEPLIQQTEVAASQTWLEEPTTTPQEIAEKHERQSKRRKAMLVVGGALLVFIAVILLLMKVLSRPPEQIVEIVAPTLTPTSQPALTPLLSRIIEAKERTKSIDIREAELSLPQVEFDLWLDEPKKP